MTNGFLTWAYSARGMSSPISPDLLLRRVAILNARKANPDMPVAHLAERLHMPVSTVHRTLKLLETTPKQLLDAFGHDAVAAWLKAVPIAALKGDHRPAKDLLLHARHIEPVQLQGQTSIAIIFAGAPVVPGLSPSSSDNDGLRVIPNELSVIDASVTDTSKTVTVGADTPGGDPPPAPANALGIFPPETNGGGSHG
jgi:hypothetical protein